MDLVAVSERVADTLRRDAALTAAGVTVEWGSAPKFTYGDTFPLARVSPGRPPVPRRSEIGTGASPDRHQPQLTVGAIEVAVITEAAAFSADAQRSAWSIARLVESALAANPRLADADGGDRLATRSELGSIARHGPNIGREREGVTVMLTVYRYEDLILNTSRSGEEARA